MVEWHLEDSPEPRLSLLIRELFFRDEREYDGVCEVAEDSRTTHIFHFFSPSLSHFDLLSCSSEYNCLALYRQQTLLSCEL